MARRGIKDGAIVLLDNGLPANDHLDNGPQGNSSPHTSRFKAILAERCQRTFLRSPCSGPHGIRKKLSQTGRYPCLSTSTPIPAAGRGLSESLANFPEHG